VRREEGGSEGETAAAGEQSAEREEVRWRCVNWDVSVRCECDAAMTTEEEEETQHIVAGRHRQSPPFLRGCRCLRSAAADGSFALHRWSEADA
jgi:hypothetical protein